MTGTSGTGAYRRPGAITGSRPGAIPRSPRSPGTGTIRTATMPSPSTPILGRRAVKRDRLLTRIEGVLRDDGRVAAAWLVGSLGLGTTDALSDLDLWVVLADEHREAAVTPAARHALVAAVRTPQLAVEALRNAPEAGGCLFTLYPGETGACRVDWHWQPRAAARFPVAGRLLVGRVGIPPVPAPTPTPLSDRERAEVVIEKVALFWVATALTARAVARRRLWDAGRMIGWAIDPLDEAAWSPETSMPAGHDDLRDRPRPSPPTAPRDRLALVRGRQDDGGPPRRGRGARRGGSDRRRRAGVPVPRPGRRPGQRPGRRGGRRGGQVARRVR